MHTAFSFTTLSASGTRFRMLPKACIETEAVLLVEVPSAAAVLKLKHFYLSLESPIKSSNNDGFPSVGHLFTELHNVWELQEVQKQQLQEEEGAMLCSRSSSAHPRPHTYKLPFIDANDCRAQSLLVHILKGTGRAGLHSVPEGEQKERMSQAAQPQVHGHRSSCP